MGAPPRCPDAEFMRLFSAIGATELSAKLGVTERNIYRRRSKLEAKNGQPINAPTTQVKEYPHRQRISIKNGTVVIGSDFHIWPGEPSTCLRAFKKFVDDIRPAAVILNGDVADFPKISRHPPMGWESAPDVKDELEAIQDHTNDIATAARRARKIHTLGNHDARFEVRLATVASEYRGIKGIHLSDHLPLWEKGWSCWVNDDVVIKHRWKGGVHATHNNTVNAGKTMVTGHLHSQKVTPYTDYNGTRWGVDTGCVAETDGKQFTDYLEDSPTNWRSGFAVLTFKEGQLLPPELVTKWSDNQVVFRGELIRV